MLYFLHLPSTNFYNISSLCCLCLAFLSGNMLWKPISAIKKKEKVIVTFLSHILDFFFILRIVRYINIVTFLNSKFASCNVDYSEFTSLSIFFSVIDSLSQFWLFFWQFIFWRFIFHNSVFSYQNSELSYVWVNLLQPWHFSQNYCSKSEFVPCDCDKSCE